MANKTSTKAGPSQEHILFNAIEPGLSEETLQFRLVHFWEARNPTKGGILIGMELLMIDEKSTVIQGFIAPNRIGRFEAKLKRGSIYKLTSFYAAGNKTMYRVTDHKYAVCFTDKSTLSEIVDQDLVLDLERFRFHSFAQFKSNCDKRGDLYDVIGHIRLINGQNLGLTTDLDAPRGSHKEMVSVHLQPKEGPVLNIYLWDNAAAEFRRKIKSRETTPTVLLVRTVNPKNLGGKVSLASMSSSRVFFDNEVPPTAEYLTWLGTNAPTVDASHVTKVETLAIAEIFQFLKSGPPQKASFNCIATIDHINKEAGWYYIGCTGCSTKLIKGTSTLFCPKCENSNAMGVIKFRMEYSVRDKESEANFVFLDEAGANLIGRKAAELIDDYVQPNEKMVADQDIPLPRCLSEVRGQTYKFEIKITEFNFRASRQTFTVTKVLKPETPSEGETDNIQQPEDLNPTHAKVDHPTKDTRKSSGENSNGKDLEESTEEPGMAAKRARVSV